MSQCRYYNLTQLKQTNVGTYANKTQDKSTSTTDSSAMQQSSGPSLQFVTDRPEAVMQRRLQALADGSPQVSQLRAISDMAGNGIVQMAGPRREEMDPPSWRRAITTDSAPIADINRRGKDQLYKNRGKTTWSEIAEYGILAGGLGTAGAGKATSTFASADTSAFSTAGILGGTSGILGGLGDAITLGKDLRSLGDSANSKDTRLASGMDALGSASSMVKSGATAAVNFAEVGSELAKGATTLAGGASLIMGGWDMASGLYGAMNASDRRDRIEENIDKRGYATHLNFASKMAAASQGREKRKGLAKMGKGAYAVSGGAALLMGAGPIGWILLSVAAAIGGAAAIYNYIKKRKHKKETVIDLLGIRGVREEWKAKKKGVEKDHSWWRRTARKNAMADIGPDPLDVALKVHGYSDVGHCYANFVNTFAVQLYEDGVLADDEASAQLITNMGLKIDFRRREPSPKKIAAKLSV